MLSVQTIQMLLTGVIVGGVIGSTGIFAFLKKKGVDVPKVLDNVDKTLESVQPVINLAKTIAPLNPIVNVVELIDKYAVTGVKNAEQLYHSNQLTGDDRNKTAKDTVYAALKEFNITPTENQQKLINDTIEASVYNLPHTPADVKQLQVAVNEQSNKNVQLQNENAQLKGTLDQQNNQITQVQAENTTLKNTISQIQNTVGVNQANTAPTESNNASVSNPQQQ